MKMLKNFRTAFTFFLACAIVDGSTAQFAGMRRAVSMEQRDGVYRGAARCPQRRRAKRGCARGREGETDTMDKKTQEKISVPCGERRAEATLTLPAGQVRAAAVFSHGFGGGAEDFSEDAAYLAERGVASLALTFCGSSARAERYLRTTQMTVFTETEELCAAIGSLAERMPGKPLFAFGASQGGLVAALAAERMPEALSGIALLYPALCLPDDWRRNFPRREDIPSVHPLWSIPLGKIFYESVYDVDVYSEIGTFPRPVLLMHGARDRIVPIAYSRRAAALYPHARLEEFPDEGHGFRPAACQKVRELFADFVLAGCGAGQESPPEI